MLLLPSSSSSLPSLLLSSFSPPLFLLSSSSLPSLLLLPSSSAPPSLFLLSSSSPLPPPPLLLYSSPAPPPPLLLLCSSSPAPSPLLPLTPPFIINILRGRRIPFRKATFSGKNNMQVIVYYMTRLLLTSGTYLKDNTVCTNILECQGFLNFAGVCSLLERYFFTRAV